LISNTRTEDPTRHSPSAQSRVTSPCSSYPIALSHYLTRKRVVSPSFSTSLSLPHSHRKLQHRHTIQRLQKSKKHDSISITNPLNKKPPQCTSLPSSSPSSASSLPSPAPSRSETPMPPSPLAAPSPPPTKRSSLSRTSAVASVCCFKTRVRTGRLGGEVGYERRVCVTGLCVNFRRKEPL
ncbi:hypothetical protein BU23DRAFT_213440, partial [Bimuria novae-zelandiae CBS 107.79]